MTTQVQQEWDEFPNPNKEQTYVMERFSRCVGRTLSQVEAVFPEGKQCDSIKKILQGILYDTRNELLRFLK